MRQTFCKHALEYGHGLPQIWYVEEDGPRCPVCGWLGVSIREYAWWLISKKPLPGTVTKLFWLFATPLLLALGAWLLRFYFPELVPF